MRRLAATMLALGIGAGVLALICVQRWVAEVDDLEALRARSARVPHEHSWSPNGCVCTVCGITAQQMAAA